MSEHVTFSRYSTTIPGSRAIRWLSCTCNDHVNYPTITCYFIISIDNDFKNKRENRASVTLLGRSNGFFYRSLIRGKQYPSNYFVDNQQNSWGLRDQSGSTPTWNQTLLDRQSWPILGRVPKVPGTLPCGNASGSCGARATSRVAPWSPDKQSRSHSFVLCRDRS